ncbi:hypothetical protein NPIL_164771 [Nephila pilipes]|uniref:Uncharacterized protein n=1 Tax=Nephila pilipes TaxID=299642 RepID=A0A8X6NQ20_NEPPI|nr:hypothetical protein NPIL_164771 [Nephila pilipes]
MPSIKKSLSVLMLLLAVLPKPSSGDVELAGAHAYLTLPPDLEPIPSEEQKDTEEEACGKPSAQIARGGIPYQ